MLPYSLGLDIFLEKLKILQFYWKRVLFLFNLFHNFTVHAEKVNIFYPILDCEHNNIQILLWIFLRKWAFPASCGFFPLLGAFLHYNWQIFTMVNDDWKHERKRKIMPCSNAHILKKSLVPSKNRYTAILNQKSPSPSRDSNLACPDRMSSLYCLCHHHGHEFCQEQMHAGLTTDWFRAERPWQNENMQYHYSWSCDCAMNIWQILLMAVTI